MFPHSVFQFIMGKLHFPTCFALWQVSLYLFIEIRETPANKTVPCETTGCREDETCRLGKCIKTPEHNEECLNKPCEAGNYCEDGKCVKNPSCGIPCPHREECYLQQVQCFTDPCPPVPSCREKVDKCASARCSDGEMCVDGECVVDERCALMLCVTGTYCYKGSCLSEVPCEGRCGPAEKCYEGRVECPDPPCLPKMVCRFDKCAVVRCRSGYKCEDGACIVNSGY